MINAKQEWAIKKMLRVRDVEIIGNGLKNELFVVSHDTKAKVDLHYTINVKGAISLTKEIRVVETVWTKSKRGK